MPNQYCIGEMLNYDAPTGGYLLTACLATGRHAGGGVSEWLNLNFNNQNFSKKHEAAEDYEVDNEP